MIGSKTPRVAEVKLADNYVLVFQEVADESHYLQEMRVEEVQTVS
jgi:hypothetical protein